MTQDEIIEMAMKAGAFELDTGEFITDDINLSIFAKLVAAKEREACAKLADALHETSWPDTIAAAIRARGEA